MNGAPVQPTPSGSPSPPVLLLIDGHAYAYRAFHAIRSLLSPDGKPTNAIFGFVKMTLKMRATLSPSHLLVVWDGGLATERLTLLPEYKAQRPPTPPDLDPQLPQMADWLSAIGWTSLQVEGTEADDWIATYARRAASQQWKVVIASSDKDFMQLVDDRIGLLNPNDKSEKIWTRADVEARTGIQPSQVVDWLSLIGDAVDNIPGVPGVGPKTATDLLQRFGSADAILSRLPEIKADRMRASLLGATDAVRRNQRMIRLHDTFPDGPGLDALAPSPPDVQRLQSLYRNWGFRSLLAELGGDSPPLLQPSLL